jgi:hypothetical protein
MRNTSPRYLRRASALLAAAGTAGLLAGCGLHNPNTASLGSATPAQTKAITTTTSAASATTKQSTPRNAGSANQKAAIIQYADLWCNWTTSNLMSHERQLEAISVGGARSQEEASIAAPTEGGTHLTNTCTIESLALGRGDASGKWVLVTASQTSTPTLKSLAPQFHVTYATLAKRGTTYLVNSWSPQS